MKKIILLIAVSIFSASAQAQDAIYLSGLLGLTHPDIGGDIVKRSELSYGLRAGVLFSDHVAAGIYINQVSSTGNRVSPGLDADVNMTNIMGEVTYHFVEADENGFWISGLLGITQAKVEYSSTFATTDESSTSYGASVGYNFVVSPNFSIGPQVTYIHIASDSSMSESSAMANLTFWF